MSTWPLSPAGLDSPSFGLDQSVSILQSIFGQPVNALMGMPGSADGSATPGTLLTDVLGYFDNMVLAFIAAIFVYVVVVGTVHTARDGKFLGKLDTHWTPIRLILGPTMVFPVKGLCLVQMLTLYIVLVGVNLADHVWQYALGQMKFQPPTALPAAVSSQVAKQLGTIFVYQAVKSTIGAFHPSPLTVGVSGGTLNIFGSHSQDFLNALLKKCSTQLSSDSFIGSNYVSMCKNAAYAMFNNQVNSVYYPAAPLPVSTSQTGVFTNLYLSLYNNGKGPATSAGTYSGKYTFNPNASLISKHNAATCAYIQAWKTTADPSKMTFAAGTNIDTDYMACELLQVVNSSVINTTTQNIVDPSSVKAFAASASFEGLVDNIIDVYKAQMQKASAAAGVLTNTDIPGTGQTCAPDNKSQCYVNGVKAEGKVKGMSYANSWWYASDVYLNLNQQLANNISALAKKVQSFRLNPANVQLGSMDQQCETPSGASSNTTCLGFVPSMTVNVAAMQYYGYNGVPSTSVAAKNMMTLASVSPVFKPVKGVSPLGMTQIKILLPSAQMQNANITMDTWAHLICPYQQMYTLDANGNPENCPNAAFLKDNGMVVKQATAQGAPSVGLNPIGDPAFYNLLTMMPAEYQAPISDLLYLTAQAPTKLYKGLNLSKKGAYLKTRQIISNIIAVLETNHVYPGSQTQSLNVNSKGEMSPVQQMVQRISNHIIGKRLPGNYTPFPNASTGEHALAATSQIFYQIYQLGNNTPGNMTEVLNTSFNNIATAQQIGLSMINVIINAASETTQFIQNTMQGFINQDQSAAKSIEKTGVKYSAISGSLGVLGAISGPFGAGASTAAMVTETAGQILVMVKQVKLQQQIVNQNYDMMMDLMWIPIGVCIATMLFSAGISFALLVPLIPYILFWAGQIAWLLGVIEAMIAAPLLALAITHPGGHETWGHTVPGLRMLLGVTLRPVLMILGLITGLILTFIVIKFSSQGFQIISTEIISFAAQSSNYASGPSAYTANAQALLSPNATMVQGVLASLMLMLFCGFMVMAFNKCFSTIYLFPEKVVQWIGGQAAQAGKEEMQQVSGQASGMASQAGQSGAQSMGQMGSASAGMAQGSGNTAASGADKTVGIASSAAGKGGKLGEAAGSVGSPKGKSGDNEGKGVSTDE